MQCGSRSLSLYRPHVMGILNVTPDSFSDGGQLIAGRHVDLDQVLVRAQTMVSAGATVLDVGGESTRPGATPVSVQEELDRVIPAVEKLVAEVDAVVSVDTSTPEVMAAAAAAGCGLLNDVRALTKEGALAAAAATGLPVCLMHMQGQPGTMQNNPEYADVVVEVKSYLQRRADACEAAGIGQQRIILDPGFGFGKSLAHNLRLLNCLRELADMGYPLLIGTSRKSMIGLVLDKPVSERLAGNLTTAVLALERGAWLLRVHDVAATVDAMKMTQAVLAEQAVL